MRRIAGWVMILLGISFSAFGVWAVAAYVWGVIGILDEPDKSWVFWGLAVVVIGIVSLGAGIGFFVTGRRVLGNDRGAR